MATYSLGNAARILKVAPSRLRYWDRTSLVSRDEDANATGYDFRDLVSVRSILSLLDQGISLQRIRRSIESVRKCIPDLADPAGALRLWCEGSPRVVVDHNGLLFEPDGQVVLDFRRAPPSLDVEDVPEVVRFDELGQTRSDLALRLFEEGCRLDADASTYDEAISVYRRGIAADPSFADIHCNLGAVYYNKGDREKARGCFENCIELAPEHVEAHFNLGNLLEEAGSDEIALEHYRVALESDPLCADLQINLALLCEKLGRHDQSRDHWRRYLQIDSTGAWAEVARLRLEGDA